MWQIPRGFGGAAVVLVGWTVARGQTVQQPVFQSFSTGTTVTVPDGGSGLLGGVSSARYGSSSRGTPILGKLPGVGRLFNNRAIGNEFTTSRNYVRAQIIDLNEWDQAVLSQAHGNRINQQPTVAGQRLAMDPAAAAVHREAQVLTQNMGRRGAARTAPVRRGEELGAPSDARRLLALGDQALADGKLELATRYFRAAERAAAGAPTSNQAAVVQRYGAVPSRRNDR